jgi:hypothetical protein
MQKMASGSKFKICAVFVVLNSNQYIYQWFSIDSIIYAKYKMVNQMQLTVMNFPNFLIGI